MPHYKNEDLQNRLRARAEEIKKTMTAGDKTVLYQLVDEFREEFLKINPERKDTAIYQMIGYYLRPANTTGRDRRKVYTQAVLKQLMVMTPKAREDYGIKTGRSLRAVNAALERFRAAQDAKAEVDLAVTSTLQKIEAAGFFDFSNPLHLKALGLDRGGVLNVRTQLEHPFGLELRAPNMLYHAPSKRRYYMITSEQLAIIEDPKKFLKSRVDHIKQNWVIEEQDPIDVAAEEVTPTVRRGYPLNADGTVDMTQPRFKSDRTIKLIVELTERLQSTRPTQPGSTLFTELAKLKAQVDLHLENLVKPFDANDPETFVDDTKGA